MAANRQALEFIAIDDPEICSQMFGLVHFAGHLEWNPPLESRPSAYITILFDRGRQKEIWQSFDAAHAAENIALAAWEEEIGSCFICSFHKDKVRELLSVPDEYDITMVIALGYPSHKSTTEDMKGDDFKYWRGDDGTFHVPKRPLANILHNNIFGKKG